jgi:hypothetical protein
LYDFLHRVISFYADYCINQNPYSLPERPVRKGVAMVRPRQALRSDQRQQQRGQTMTNNLSTIDDVIVLYFDGLHEGDADKLGAIFHPSADLRWLEKGELQVLTVSDWLERIRKRPSAKAEGKPREDFVVTIDRSDDSTAFIKVRCQLPPRYFTDYLVAMKLTDGWQIVSKSYRYDLRD